LLTDHVARCTEHAAIQRRLRIRKPPLAPARIGTELEHCFRIETDISDQGGHRRRIRRVLLILPDRLQHAMGKLDRRLVTHGFPQTDDARGARLGNGSPPEAGKMVPKSTGKIRKLAPCAIAIAIASIRAAPKWVQGEL